MYAGTQVNWHEVLAPTDIAVNQSLPLFLCAFSCDKGPEKITDLEYEDFRKMYGNSADYFKYGQPLIQAHRILQAGGRVLGKRIVASDATLANLIIAAEVTAEAIQKGNENGDPLYIDENGQETTTETETPATYNRAKIKYKTYNAPAVTTFKQVENYAKTLEITSGDVQQFPLFIVCDNGRGKSIKRVKISTDYISSRKSSFMLYRIADYEGTDLIEQQRFAIKSDATAKSSNNVRKSLILTRNTCQQFEACQYSDFDKFIKRLAEITGYTSDELYSLDVLFAKTIKQTSLANIVVDNGEGSTNLSAEYGISLISDENANGSFGDAPFPGEQATDEWAAEAVKFFNESFSDEIYDLDQYKIDFCVDANYPFNPDNVDLDVKRAIANLAIFREDFYYFRDLELDIPNLEDVASIVSDRTWIQSPFIGDYESTYDIIDPWSRKQIKVTMLYGLAPLLVDHYLNNISAPVAGEFNNFVITDAVDGTLNFVPRVTPNYDQKQILEDLRINYVNYTSEGYLSVQSTYTSQDHNGPLSYTNNVLVTQRVIKAIREYCPKIRFMLMDAGTTNFAKYKTLIEDNVISRYTQYFKSITLTYTADDEMTNAKIFNASLYCYYRDFPQGEIFDVFAIEGSPSNEQMV